jgi:nicotinamide mononucleotide transporter
VAARHRRIRPGAAGAHARLRGRLVALAALALAWPATGLFLDRFTDTDVPWWDAFPTAASVLGQWLLGRKYVENWPVWIAVNVVAIGLFAYKGCG